MPATLLLADDSVTIQRVIELTFAGEDVDVVAVGDGQAAVDWLEHHVPDAVLADVTVPGVDGYDLSAFVRGSDRLRHVPVLLLAGAFEPLDDDRVRESGCDGVLVKPFEPQQLVSRVRDLIGGRKASTPAPAPAQTRVEAPARATTPPAQADPAGAASADAPVHVSLANAFAALLTAERAIAQAAPAPGAPPSAAPAAGAALPSETELEAAVRRVLVRMTDDLVRRLLTESAERLIREEIAKIRANPG